MKFKLDGKVYKLDLSKVIEFERAVYTEVNTNGILVDGKLHRFDSGIMRTAVNMIMTPIVLPIIRKMYMSKGIVLEPPAKHSDLVDYAVHAMLDYVSMLERKFYADFTCEISNDCESTIVSVAPSFIEEEPAAILAIQAPKTDRENE